MSGTQTTIPFPVRKKCSFYGRKEEVKEDFTDATARHTSSRYVPAVRKIVTLTSSESESDSDIENTMERCKVTRESRIENAGNTPRRRKCDESEGESAKDISFISYNNDIIRKTSFPENEFECFKSLKFWIINPPFAIWVLWHKRNFILVIFV